MPVNPREHLARAVLEVFPHETPRIGVAVSGGGDSMALLDLLCRAGVQVEVVSVNHGLRPEAVDEIALVADYCAERALPHDCLTWAWDGRGSLQEAARAGRAALIADWARARGLTHVALGHTADDQAETVLMRLARGSGVDGLAAMSVASEREGVTWLRPLLDVRRADLRAYLKGAGIAWADDPSNEDAGYDRVKARQALEVLAPLGLSVERLTRTAAHMARAREALEFAAADLAREAVTLDAGDVVIAGTALRAAPEELQTRLVAEALGWVSGRVYRPRYAALRAAMAAKAGHALQGCLLLRHKGTLRITREWAAVAESRAAVDAVWDGRWQLTGPEETGLEIRALGASGLMQCPDWRDTGRPRQSLLSTPAVWRGDTLVAAPLAGVSNGWYAALTADRAKFTGSR